jgi:sugar phosphate isomerase/epimerase
MALALPGAINATNPKKDLKVSVCDWMILKRQKIGEFQLASQLGYDGVEVDMGSLGNREQFDNKLREAEFQKLFSEKAAEFDVEISSIAMSGFYGQSFAARSNYKALAEDCLNTMEAMDVKVAFLPLGTGCDLTKNPEVRPELVSRLHEVGDMAAARGLVIGIETSLDAAAEKALLKEIGSKGIKIYYKFQNALENNRDINSELKKLGRKRICQIHCTDTDGVTLRHNTRLDLPSIIKTLRKMHWSGWLVVERSRNKEDVRNVKANYGDNAAYLKEIIQ